MKISKFAMSLIVLFAFAFSFGFQLSDAPVRADECPICNCISACPSGPGDVGVLVSGDCVHNSCKLAANRPCGTPCQ